MRISLLAVAAIGLASTAAAQMPLPAWTNTFTAGLTRGFWFQAPANAVITGLAVPNEASQPFQVVEVIDLGLAAPPAFPGTVTGTTLFYDNTAAGGSIIATAIPLVAGNFYGVLGACNNAQGSATSYNSYGANGPFLSDYLGIPTTITRFGTQSGIAANGGGQPCWSEAAFNVSRVEVYLSSTGGGTIATNSVLGQGCYRQFASVYENFAAGAFDLDNTALTFISTGGTYVVTSGGTYNAVGSVGTPTNLALTDDSQIAAGTQGITVGSNGWIAFGAGNSNAFTPSVATFLNNPSSAFYSWRDINPASAGSGPVVYEEDGMGNAQITFDGTYNFGSATPNFIQFQVNANGDVVIAWQTQPTTGTGTLVGYSPGGANVDPGQSNLSDVASGMTTIVTGATDILPLTLAATSRPVIGTNWNLAVSNSALLDLIILGVTDPNIPDLFFLGLPGCGLRANLDLVQVGSTASVPLPNDPMLVGAMLFANGASLSPGVNAFGALTSNGIQGTIGDL